MTTPTLPDQLCALVDQVDVPTFAEVRAHAVAPRTHQRAAAPRRRVVAALVAVLLLVVVSAVTFALVREEYHSSPRVEPAVTTAATELPADCVVTSTTSPGCEMTPDEAARFLGFQPGTASGIPDGWVKIWSRLRVYRNPLPDGEPPLPAGFDNVGLFMQIWAPPGTDVNALGDCYQDITVRQRIVFPGEDIARSGEAVPLGNGTVAYGRKPYPDGGRTGCSPEQVGSAGSLTWARDGVSISVEGNGVTLTQMTAVARSVDR